jgi:hypothetical protein
LPARAPCWRIGTGTAFALQRAYLFQNIAAFVRFSQKTAPYSRLGNSQRFVDRASACLGHPHAGENVAETGDAAFAVIKREVLVLWQQGIASVTPLEGEHPIGAFYSAKVHASNEDQLGLYFRIIYSMLRRISEAEFLSDDEKISYSNLLRNQLTSRELFVIGVNGLAEISGDLARYLAEFRMFKNLPEADKDMFLSTCASVHPTYENAAFEGRAGKDV